VNWIKTAALCWDEVYTLTSPDSPGLTEDVAELNEKLGGFISGIDVRTFGQHEQLISSFEQWLDSEESKGTLGELTNGNFLQGGSAFFGIFPGKLPGGRITQRLTNLGLARGGFNGERKAFVGPVDDIPRLPEEGAIDYVRRLRASGAIDEDSQLYLPSNVALQYLSMCAANAASTYQADLYGQSELFAKSAIASQQRARAKITSRILETFIPQNLESLEIGAIIELREALATHRLRYATGIHAIVDEFSKVASPEELEKLGERIVAIAQQRIEETRNAYRRANLAAVVRAVGISIIPSSVTSLGSLLGTGVFLPAAVAAAVVLASADFLVQREKACAELAASPWSYVIELERRLD